MGDHMRGLLAACLLLASFAAPFAFPAMADDQLIAAYQKGCAGGDAFLCNALGMELERSSQTAAERAKAAAAFQKGCDGGAALACLNGGDLYMSGVGIAKDPQKAGALYRKACDGRNSEACGKLAQLSTPSGGSARDTMALAPASKPAPSAAAQPRRTDFWWIGATAGEAIQVLIDRASIRQDKNGRTGFLLEFFEDASDGNGIVLDVRHFPASLDCPNNAFYAPDEDDYRYTLDKQGRWHGTFLGQKATDLPAGPIDPDTLFVDVYEFVCKNDTKAREEAKEFGKDADLDLALEGI